MLPLISEAVYSTGKPWYSSHWMRYGLWFLWHQNSSPVFYFLVYFYYYFFFNPDWDKNGFVVLEIFLQDWKDFSCACCLWSCISQCDYNIALMLSRSLFFGAAKHNSVRVALFWAGSKFWALLSALKLSNVWKAGGWWDLVGTFGRCGVWKAVFT